MNLEVAQPGRLLVDVKPGVFVEGSRARPLVKSFARVLRETPDYTRNSADHLMMLQNSMPDGMKKHLLTYEMLSKAMGTTSGLLGSPTLSSANQLLLENLDPLMTSVLYKQEHLKLFNMIPRIPSVQVLFQWIRQTGFGGSRRSLGFREGGAPQGGGSAFTRGSGNIMFYGTRRGVTWQMSLAGANGGVFVDPEQKEQMDGTMEMLSILERQLVWGHAGILDANANTVNYNGIYRQLLEGTTHGGASIIDKQGNPLDPEDFETFATQLKDRGKLPSLQNIRSLWQPGALADLGKIARQGERRELTQGPSGNYVLGTNLAGYMSQFGFIPFDDSILMQQVEGNKPLATGDAGNAGALGSAPTAAAANVSGAEVSYLAGQSYQYAVSSLNDSGESTATFLASAVAVNAGQKVTVTIPRLSGATGYVVYRQDVGVATTDIAKAYVIAIVPQSVSGNIDFVDFNQIRPDTYIGMLLNLDPEDIVIPQLAPMTKWPLAVTNTTVEFLLILAHALFVKAPERMVFVKNIGKRA